MVDGVRVEARATAAGFNAHRAEVSLCTDIESLKAYIVDISHLHEWIPDTEEVRLLDNSASSITFYLKTRAPWPFKDRDLIYQLTEIPPQTDGVDQHIAMIGLPDYLPESKDAYRMREATGEWRITDEDARIRVSYQLYLNPGGRVPKFLANRRLQTSFGRTLANLADHFTCESAS